MPLKKKTLTDAVFLSLQNKENIKKAVKRRKKVLTLDEKIVNGIDIFLKSPFDSKWYYTP